ncbi:MFS transporter [Kitasatospora sp. NPDC059571]|uniref:MFS transporter n=1 Tax=Kitasatospora sp. NPDC059571 TaxID=3346871 RepID=UPI0036B4DCF1
MTVAAGTDTPARPAARHPARWPVLAVVCLVQLAVVLDNTVLGVAVPTLTRSLGASTAELQWIVNAYPVVQAGLLLTAGSATDRYGRRRMLLAGLAVFGLGSLAAGLSTTTGALIAARAVMGVGGALLTTTTLAVVLQVYEGPGRARAIGAWSAVGAVGYAAGPPVGGLLLAHFSWGALFVVNLPPVLAALAAALLLVPESRGAGGGRPDLPGALLSTAGTAAVVYAIVSGGEHGPSSARVLVPAVLGVLALAAFAVWERRCRHPMLDLGLFHDRRFTGAVTGVVLITFGSTGVLFLLTQQLQFVRGYPPLEAGLRMAPFALTAVALNLGGPAARAGARLGVPGSIAAGTALLAGGFALAAQAGPGYGQLAAGLVLMGTGCAVANPALVAAVMDAVPPDRAGAGAGIDGTMAELGAGLGVAVLGAVLNARFAALLPAGAATGSLPAALAAAPSAADRAAVLDAFAAAARAGQLAGAATVLAGGLTAALLLHRAGRPPRL